MCGRYYLTVKLDQLLKHFGIEDTIIDYQPRTEIFPSQSAPVIIAGDSGKTLQNFHWGFPLSFSSKLIINARAETVDRKKTFKKPFKDQRCLIPASGFFEWKDKQKYRIYHQQQSIISLAGLYSTFKKGDSTGTYFTIITTAAGKNLQEIHNRSPLIFSRAQGEKWLDPEIGPDHLKNLLTVDIDNNLKIREEEPGQLNFDF